MALLAVEVRVKEIVAGVPGSAVLEAGDPLSVKSSAGAGATISTALTECEIAPEVAVTVRGYVPGGVVAEVEIVMLSGLVLTKTGID